MAENLEYVVMTKFHLSQVNRDLIRGETLMFDGNMAEFPGGQKVPAPTLIAAKRAGWIRLKSEVGEIAVDEPRVNPTLKVRKQMETVVQDSLEVRNSDNIVLNRNRKAANRQNHSKEEVKILQAEQQGVTVDGIGDTNDRLARDAEYKRKLFASQNAKAAVAPDGETEGIRGLTAKVTAGSTSISQEDDGDVVATINKTASEQVAANIKVVTGVRDPEADKKAALEKRKKANETAANRPKKAPPKLVQASEEEIIASHKKERKGKTTLVDSSTVITEDGVEVDPEAAAQAAAEEVINNPYPEEGTDKEKLAWLAQHESKALLFKVYTEASDDFKEKLEIKFGDKYDFSKAEEFMAKKKKIVE